jgi:hypothetical protein
MSRFTLDSATDFLFGACVNSLQGRLPYPHNIQIPDSQKVSSEEADADAFARGFHLAQEVLLNRGRVGSIWPLWEILRDRTKEPMKLIRSYLDPIIKKATERQQETEKCSDTKGDKEENETLLDHLVKSTSGVIHFYFLFN